MMPTTKELMDELKFDNISVSYRDSRYIVKHLNEPVLAYGIGLGCFIVVIKSNGFYNLKAWAYSGKRIFTSNYLSGFDELEPEKALKIIKENKFICRKQIDEKAIRQQIYDKQIKYPIVGEIEVEYYQNKKKSHRYKYQIFKWKDGNYGCIEQHNDYKSNLCNITYFKDRFDKEFKDDWTTYEIKIVKNTISEEVMKEIGAIVMAKKL